MRLPDSNRVVPEREFPPAHPEPVEGIILGVKQVGFYVYILNCADGSFYTGHTDNLEARMVAHETGQIPGYTQTRRPLRLVFAEELSTRQEAFERERQIKGCSRRLAAFDSARQKPWFDKPVLSRAEGLTMSGPLKSWLVPSTTSTMGGMAQKPFVLSLSKDPAAVETTLLKK